jgi:predicted ATPase/DNA-binding CsgD family transcriptional regulator
LTTHGGRLPAETSRFFGRSAEAAAIQDALVRSRLVTLTGPGGVGKTRLAVKVAGEHARRFRDGVFLADLSAARDAGDVARTVAAALGPPGRDGQRDRPGPAGSGELGGLAGRLRGRRLLLILDTCEHVVDACAALADEVLCEGGGPVLLLTSRQPLGLPGEMVVRVPPLATGDAVRLFADRARAAAPGFAATAYTVPKLERLCRLLDGIPLAIELAALRLRAVGLDELLARLPGQQRLLGSGRAAVADRRHSLQASISWSFDLCSPAERLLWTRLSVFDGSFDLAAAEGLYPDDEPGAYAVLGTLAGLVDKSVVLRAPDTGGVARYWLPAIAREQGAALRAGAAMRNAVPRPRPATSPRRRVAPAGQSLGARPFTAAVGPGGADLDDAGYAAAWALLTAREREVAVLVALGLTSKDIAARLVVSKRTVDSHLEHILGKLGYNSRVQVAALAAHEQAREQREPEGRARISDDHAK